jgi:endonuclease/exonuclease/phosphatase family metal-dependent hydrolase
VAGVSAIIRDSSLDLVALQEVTRVQSRRLATSLEMDGRWWVFKHWPVRGRPEGLAVLTPHPAVATEAMVLQRAPLWSWRRRVAIGATLAPEGGGVAVVNAHLSPHDAEDRRVHEAGELIERATAHESPPIICGDLNELPGGPAYQAFARAGWRDAWVAVHGDGAEVAGASNWTAGRRLGRPPTQRIDFVFVPPGWSVEGCEVAVGADRFDHAAALSDHLPVVATLRSPVQWSDPS